MTAQVRRWLGYGEDRLPGSGRWSLMKTGPSDSL